LNRNIGLFWFFVLSSALPVQAAESGLRPLLVIAEPVFLVFEFRPGAAFSHEFILFNQGGAPLEIGEVRTGCSCAVAAYDRTIAPGGQGRVRLTVEVYRQWAGRELRRTVWLTTNDPGAAQVTLVVRGRVAESAADGP
jgi:hypothetical protein